MSLFPSESQKPPATESHVLRLFCPACGGRLKLQRCHIGIAGHCVHCEVPIRAEMAEHDTVFVRLLGERGRTDSSGPLAHTPPPLDEAESSAPAPVETRAVPDGFSPSEGQENPDGPGDEAPETGLPEEGDLKSSHAEEPGRSPSDPPPLETAPSSMWGFPPPLPAEEAPPRTAAFPVEGQAQTPPEKEGERIERMQAQAVQPPPLVDSDGETDEPSRAEAPVDDPANTREEVPFAVGEQELFADREGGLARDAAEPVTKPEEAGEKPEPVSPKESVAGDSDGKAGPDLSSGASLFAEPVSATPGETGVSKTEELFAGSPSEFAPVESGANLFDEANPVAQAGANPWTGREGQTGSGGESTRGLAETLFSEQPFARSPVGMGEEERSSGEGSLSPGSGSSEGGGTPATGESPSRSEPKAHSMESVRRGTLKPVSRNRGLGAVTAGLRLLIAVTLLAGFGYVALLFAPPETIEAAKRHLADWLQPVEVLKDYLPFDLPAPEAATAESGSEESRSPAPEPRRELERVLLYETPKELVSDGSGEGDETAQAPK